MANHFVFVYGTLKRGEPNHFWLTSESHGFARFVSVAETHDKYPLIIASKYNIPFLLDECGKGENVRGEVYEVDDKMLANLDILEDHPTFYIREIAKVNLIEGDIKINKDPGNMNCWIYFLKKFKPELLSEEWIKDYSSYGPHGKRYSEKKQRDPNYHARSDVLIS